MAAWVATDPILILKQNDTLHAVKDNGLDAVGAVFWQAGAVEKISVNTSSVVFYRTTGATFEISAAYPENTAKTVVVTVDEPLEPFSVPSGVTVTSNGFTSDITFSLNNGVTKTAEFTRTGRSVGYARIDVTDSASGSAISSAQCDLFEYIHTYGSTDSTGTVVLKSDTGTNTLSIQKSGFRIITDIPVHISEGETTTVNVSLVELAMIGLDIDSTAYVLTRNSYITPQVKAIYSDSSHTTLTSGLIWEVTPTGLLTVDSTGRVYSHHDTGTAVVTCSSAVLGFKDSCLVTVIENYNLLPVHDSYVRGGDYADDNYGTAANLPIKLNSDNLTRESYLKFDLSALSGSGVESAILKVYATAVDPSIKVALYEVADDSWEETTITWNNKPAAGAHLVSVSLTSADIGQWISIDLTEYANTQFLADQQMSICLKDSTGVNWAAFSSKEDTLHPPELEVIPILPTVQLNTGNSEIRAASIAVSPNPFSPSASLNFNLPNRDMAEINIYNVSGKLVATLLNKQLDSGEHSVKWAPGQLSSGIYIVSAKIGLKTFKEKIIFCK
jgi:hypothetical protein